MPPASLEFHRFRPHPWHGISPGDRAPDVVTAYVEITPFDSIKYEIDKETGYLKVDRPQLTSALPPACYGFIPRTYCGDRVAQLSPRAAQGDHDPLDICILSERSIGRAEVLLPARVVGGLRMIDRGEADDKIIALLDNDPYWGDVRDIADLSPVLRRRLEHYFMTYKMLPGSGPGPTHIDHVFGAEDAKAVILAAQADYSQHFGEAK